MVLWAWVGTGTSSRSAKIPLTENHTDIPDRPAPFGAAVRPEVGVSKEPTGERITYFLRALGRGREALLSKRMKSGQQLHVDEPRKPQLPSPRAFYSETWLSAQIMEVTEPGPEEVLAWIR